MKHVDDPSLSIPQSAVPCLDPARRASRPEGASQVLALTSPFGEEAAACIPADDVAAAGEVVASSQDATPASAVVVGREAVKGGADAVVGAVAAGKVGAAAGKVASAGKVAAAGRAAARGGALASSEQAAARDAATAQKALEALRSAFETHLASSLPAPLDESDLVAAGMQEAVMSHGKRMRPLLLLSTAASLGVAPADMLDAACALELVHAASLVLDDLPCMDDASLRRGRPALHLQFGEDVAALVVVALVSQAYRQVASAGSLGASLRAQLVAVLADAVGHQGLVSGQLRDLRTTAAGRQAADAARVNQLKTGSLFRAAFDMAALAAGTNAADRRRLQRCADELGQAFQLLDDLKDSGDVPSIGKSLNQDEGKRTLLAVIGREAARDRMRLHLSVVKGLLKDVLGTKEIVSAVIGQAMPG